MKNPNQSVIDLAEQQLQSNIDFKLLCKEILLTEYVPNHNFDTEEDKKEYINDCLGSINPSNRLKRYATKNIKDNRGNKVRYYTNYNNRILDSLNKEGRLNTKELISVADKALTHKLFNFDIDFNTIN